LSNHVDGADSGERGALLPTDDVAGVVAGEVYAAVRLGHGGVVLGILAPEAADPRTQVEGDVAPAYIDRVAQLVAAAGKEFFDGLA